MLYIVSHQKTGRHWCRPLARYIVWLEETTDSYAVNTLGNRLGIGNKSRDLYSS